MTLHDAYRVLEVPHGASEGAIREARKTLSKVWHPDRYTNDPALQAKAEAKLREINEAWEAVRAAGFPDAPRAGAAAAAAVATPAATPPAPAPVVAPPAPAPAATPRLATARTPPPAAATPNIELVPRRRMRWSVIVAMLAALGVGAYFAILQLGARDARPPAAVPHVDAAAPTIIAVAPDAAAPTPTPTPTPPPTPVATDLPIAIPIPSAPPAGPTFTLGSSLAEVLALQGEPNGRQSVHSDDSVTVNGQNVTHVIARDTLTYGRSEIDIVDDKVVGWWDNDVRLHVRLAPRDASVVAAAHARGTLAVGQTSDDALGVLGMPTRVNGHVWAYGTAELELDDGGRIVRYSTAAP